MNRIELNEEMLEQIHGGGLIEEVYDFAKNQTNFGRILHRIVEGVTILWNHFSPAEEDDENQDVILSR